MSNRWWPARPAALMAMVAEGGLLCLLATVPASAQAAGPMDMPEGHRARFLDEPASSDVRRVTDWVSESGDNRNLPFAVVDKIAAKIFVFNAQGVLLGASPVLLGLARGDVAPAGIGERALSSIRPDERVTPAGRFVAAIGSNLKAKEVLWVDYASAVSLHRVVTGNPREYRLRRLATESALDNRISYGCINVPARFFDSVVKPSFSGTDGIVYILPEVERVEAVFAIDRIASPSLP